MNGTARKALAWAIPLALAALALALRAWGIGWGLPQIYEEATPLKRAWDIWGWGPERTFDPNPHFFKYPSLTIYLQFLAQAVLYPVLRLFGGVGSTLDFRVVYELERTPFYVTGRLVTALFGAATVGLLFDLARRTAGRAAAWGAALLLALNVAHISKSQVVEVDVPLTFFCVLVAWASVRILARGSGRDFLVAGIALGLAVSTKYTGALFALGPVAAAWLARNRPSGNGDEGRNRLRIALLPGLLLAAGAAAVAFLATSPFVAIDFGAFRRDLAMEREHMRLGHFGLEGGFSWGRYLGILGSDLLGWPLLIGSVLGLAALAGQRRAPWAVVLACMVVPYWAVLGSWSMHADRYILPVLPLLALLGSAFVWRWLPRRFGWPATGPRGAVIPVAALLAFLIPQGLALPDHLARLRPDPRTRAKAWIEANIPAGSFLVSEAYGPELLDPLHLGPMDRELLGRVLQRELPIYGFVQIPMFQVVPENAAPYYDHALYRNADYIITSSSVSGRYRNEPERFPRQIAFYDTLALAYEPVRRFAPEGSAGPEVVLWRNPRVTRPLCAREEVLPLPDLQARGDAATGEEAVFYYSFGMTLHACGFADAALECFAAAFRYPLIRPRILRNLSLAAARVLLETGRKGDAIALLERAAATAPDADDRTVLTRMQRVLERTP